MKAIIGLLVFGFMFYLWVKLIRFVGAIFKVVNTQKPLPTKPVSRQRDSQKSPTAVSYPGEVGPEIVASEAFDEESQTVEGSIDRSFEEMGLELRFGHLPKAAKQMLKKAWTVRKSIEDEETIVLPETSARQMMPASISSVGEPGMIWKTDDLQKAFVFSEILAPPIALREE